MPDVETYVRETVRGMTSVTPAEQEELVARGIFLVRRIAQALPPEASLQEALRDHLAEGLAALQAEAGPSGSGPARGRRRAAPPDRVRLLTGPPPRRHTGPAGTFTPTPRRGTQGSQWGWEASSGSQHSVFLATLAVMAAGGVSVHALDLPGTQVTVPHADARHRPDPDGARALHADRRDPAPGSEAGVKAPGSRARAVSRSPSR